MHTARILSPDQGVGCGGGLKGSLVATVEVKSQVGSFGNNFNNRVEEAIGSATDFWNGCSLFTTIGFAS
jgi:hypothetical protein